MHILALGHNHETAPVEIREKFTFDLEKLSEALHAVKSRDTVMESVIVSTCNRNEIYSVVSDLERAASDITTFFHDFHRVDRNLIAESIYTFSQERAVEHLFEVAAGVDSMVVGETQVFGQVKDAFARAQSQSCTGPILNRLFANAFEAGKRVRSQTNIARGSVSVSSCAVDLAAKIFGDLSDKTTLLIGAGETGRHTAEHLLAAGASKFIVANRTLENAAELADKLSGYAVTLDGMDDALANADIVITATAARGYLLTQSQVKDLRKHRKGSPLFLIDLSVPRDIDPAIRKLGDVFVYDVDDLSGIAEENREQRETEVAKAREFIREDVNSFMSWYRSLGVTPTIVAMRGAFEEIRQREFERLAKNLPPEQAKQLEAMSRSLMNKFLHSPTTEMKKSSDRGEALYMSYAARRLFHLDEESNDE